MLKRQNKLEYIFIKYIYEEETMKKKSVMTTVLGAMAIAPVLMNSKTKMKKDMREIGQKSSKIAMNKMENRKTTAMVVTGLSGYLLAHAAPIRGLIRGR